MEGVIQYRLLGDHPAASGRYLTLGFPGEFTTRDKVIEQIIQEHRINTSRYKLEVRKLVAARDAPGYQSNASSSPSPQGAGVGADGAGGNSVETAVSRDATVGIVLHANDELHTYDRLTIHVSQRQLADDDANRKEQEQLERQRRVREMEEELLLATTSSVLPQQTGGAVSPPPPAFASSSSAAGASPPPPPLQESSRDGGRTVAAAAAVDPLRLQRAAALASQLFPTMKGQHGALTGVDDAANNHHCVLCRLQAFAEQITSCCRFCVCASCYASAMEMDMEEGRCPVCGSRITRPASDHDAASGDHHGMLSSHKRDRDSGEDAPLRGGWKREDTEVAKATLQRNLGIADGTSSSRGGSEGGRRSGAMSAPSRGDARGGSSGSASSPASSLVLSKEVLQIEERLRHDLDKALVFVDGPDVLSAAAKEKRVIGAELAALCGQ